MGIELIQAVPLSYTVLVLKGKHEWKDTQEDLKASLALHRDQPALQIKTGNEDGKCPYYSCKF